MLTFIGLDLAWSPRNPSGIAVLQGSGHTATLTDIDTVLTDAEILQWIDTYSGEGSVWIGIDAPLRVPNATGRRRAEADLSDYFRQYHAGAHPANRQLLTRNGQIRGEALVAALAERNILYTTHVDQGSTARQVVEVFPHPAMVSIFNLDRILKYKSKPKRARDQQNQEWIRYQTYLQRLTHQDPALQGHEEFLAQDVTQLRGQQLKGYEDQADALMCAYIVLYGWRWGSSRCRVFGSLEEGSIFTPVPLSGAE